MLPQKNYGDSSASHFLADIKFCKFFFIILIFYINSISEVFCKFSGKNVANFTLHREYAGNEVFILSTRGNKFRFNVYARYELLA
jgi:hypothetical protein